MVFSMLLCRVAGHEPDRRRAWDDHLNYRSHCKRCGTAMMRVSHGWRMFDPEGDADPRRQAANGDVAESSAV